MTPIPNKLPGTGKLVNTINQLIECVKERTIVDSATIKTEKRTFGTLLISKATEGGTGGDENVWQ